MDGKIKSIVFRYGLAIALFAAAIGISSLLTNFSIKINLTLLIMGVIFAAAWYGGRGPGLLTALLLEATAIIYTPIPPDSTLEKAVFGYFSVTLLLVSFALLISGRRKVEHNLREQRELLRVTLQSIGDAVIATDLEGRISFINPTAENLTGWSAGEITGKPLAEVFKIVNESTREPVESPIAAIVRENVIIELANQTLLIRRDGTPIPIEDSGAPIKDAKGRIIGVIIVFHDVSERRRAERDREKLLESEQAARREAELAGRGKDEFLATLSHELRTPLSAILGWSTILKKDRLEESEVKKALTVIERNARAQGEIIGDLLDISQIVTGKLAIEKEPVEIIPILKAIVKARQAQALSKSIRLTAAFNADQALVTGDAERLRQIFENLVSNAVKFTPEGGTVELRTAAPRDAARLEITVSDSGSGIDAEFLPFVFERFRQGDASTTRSHGGLGLGLSIVRHLVVLHGGFITAESKGRDHGAVFTVSLPLAENGGNIIFTDNSASLPGALRPLSD